MQANKSYFIHLDPSTQSAILSKQLVSMFEIIGMADKNLIPKDFFLKNCKYLLPFPKHLGIPDRYLVHTLFDYVYIKNCLFIYKNQIDFTGERSN